MDRLANMIAFATVAETGSFAKTADRLHIANSVVSKRIKDLEAYLGTQLLRRTTRHISLTEAGYVYAEHARQFLDDLAEVEENIRYRNENPVGDIKVSAPLSFGNRFLGPAIAGFLEKWPDVTVTLSVNDRKVDIAAEGFDLAIRIGAVEDSGLIVKKLAQSRRIVVASPAYLDQHGKPETPEDLARHNCLSYSGLAGGKSWPFQKGGREHLQHVGGRFIADSGSLLCEAAVRGCGITILPSFIVGPHVVSGELVPLLEAFESPPLAIQAVYPHRRFLSAKTRKLIDHLAATFSGFGGE
ncbi:MAG: LysR family transcriptional regulator [Alphaproteobacteria bacterium]|nr:LysR family transcriptional regulator [Alphaproteobacteria bacterium]MDE2336077.1 LysR family transcriptional regulator [Alphaproteobacteria bacterium]